MAKQKEEKGKELEDNEVIFEMTSIPGSSEEAEITGIENDLETRLKQCKERLAVCQKERQEYLDGWQRSRADHLNYKQRLEHEREREMERQAAHFIEKLLPLCDSFDLALRRFAQENGEKGEWRTGVEQIYNQLANILKSYDVETIEPKGETFDPHLHEAVSETPVTTRAQHHIVLDVLQKGYRIGKRLIRPAKIVVGSYTSDIEK